MRNRAYLCRTDMRKIFCQMANPMLPPRPLPGDTTCCRQDCGGVAPSPARRQQLRLPGGAAGAMRIHMHELMCMLMKRMCACVCGACGCCCSVQLVTYSVQARDGASERYHTNMQIYSPKSSGRRLNDTGQVSVLMPACALRERARARECT